MGGSLWDQHRRVVRPKHNADDVEAMEDSDSDDKEAEGDDGVGSRDLERAKKSGMTWMDAFGLDTDGTPYDVSPDSILRNLLRQSAAHYRSEAAASDTPANATPRVQLAAAASPPDGGHIQHSRRMSQFTRSDNAAALLELKQLPTAARGQRRGAGATGAMKSPGQAAAIVAQTADEITQLVSHPA